MKNVDTAPEERPIPIVIRRIVEAAIASAVLVGVVKLLQIVLG